MSVFSTGTALVLKDAFVGIAAIPIVLVLVPSAWLWVAVWGLSLPEWS